ncbi:MAG: hypothetical protein J2P57_02440 [Acidimicrobiaceae bacterium]|nr:hypothetical protein [Acidimicrobiaceae bacterium]
MAIVLAAWVVLWAGVAVVANAVIAGRPTCSASAVLTILQSQGCPRPTPVHQASRPSPPGWQEQRSPTYGYAYDVPTNWRILGPDDAISYGNTSGSLVMMNAADYRAGFCHGAPGSSRAFAGFHVDSNTNLAAVASDTARLWANAAYLPPTGGPSPTITASGPMPVTLDGVQAVEVTANVTLNTAGPCYPPRAVVYAVSVPGRAGSSSQSVSLIVGSDQGVSDGVPTTDLETIIGTLHAWS